MELFHLKKGEVVLEISPQSVSYKFKKNTVCKSLTTKLFKFGVGNKAQALQKRIIGVRRQILTEHVTEVANC